MSVLSKMLFRRRSLTDCLLDDTPRGKAAHHLWRDVVNARRARLEQGHRPSIGPDVEAIASKIAEHGIFIGPARSALSEEGRKALDQSTALIRQRTQSPEIKAVVVEGANKAIGKQYLVHIVPFNFRHDPSSPLLKLALDRKLLEVVSRYMGMWPRLHSISSWLNFPTGNEASHSQLWHRDPEDLKTVKVFIYLDAVGNENGPFSYIPDTHPFGPASAKNPEHRHHRRVMDNEMQGVFAEDSWVECTGPAETMIIADTVGYHRGGNVRQGQRLLITFTYTSGLPQEARTLKFRGKPGWISHPIQRYGLWNGYTARFGGSPG